MIGRIASSILIYIFLFALSAAVILNKLEQKNNVVTNCLQNYDVQTCVDFAHKVFYTN
jgi:hypothetical protein